MQLVFLDETGIRGITSNHIYLVCGLITPVDATISGTRAVVQIHEYLRKLGIHINELKGRNIWDKLKDKARRNGIPQNRIVQWIRGNMLPIYDIIENSIGNYKIICAGIDQQRYGEQLRSHFEQLENTVNTFLNSLCTDPYASVLRNNRLKNKILEEIETKINDINNRIFSHLVNFQAVSELLYRLEQHLRSVDEDCILIYDAVAETFDKSVYLLLSEALRENGVPRVRGEPLRVQKIRSYFIMDSKRTPMLQIADLIVEAMKGIIAFGAREFYERLRPHIVSSPHNPERIWGYGIKILPWREEDFLNKLRQTGGHPPAP